MVNYSGQALKSHSLLRAKEKHQGELTIQVALTEQVELFRSRVLVGELLFASCHLQVYHPLSRQG